MAAFSDVPSIPGWFRSSFDADPWATSAELLSLRDELLTARIAGGWLGGSAPQPPITRRRLAALLALVDDPNVPGDGIPDRILDVVRSLRVPEYRESMALSDLRIVVEEPQPLLPPVWRAVFEAVLGAGGTLEYRQDDTNASPGVPHPAVTVVHAADEGQAAEHLAAVLARYMAGRESVSDADGVALVVSGDAGVLDRTLESWGLPVTGRTGESAARWGLQILPAFLATLWSPADPYGIASFLSLAAGLSPTIVTRRLLHALAEHPGTGGPEWNEAIERIADSLDPDTADLYDRLFARDLYSPEEGVPIHVLEERLAWLNSRLAGRLRDRETVRFALGHVAELRGIVGSLSGGNRGGVTEYRVSRPLLDRIVGTVVRPVPGGLPEEAAPWTVHGSIANVPAGVRTVFHWNCTGGESAAMRRFTEAERSILAEAGYRPEAPEMIRTRREWNRRRALAVPGRRVVALVPERIRTEDAHAAPWLTELLSSSGTAAETIDLSSDEPIVAFTGVDVHRSESVRIDPPQPVSVHHVPPGSIPLPENLSYTSVASLIGCPMQWVLGRIEGLSAATNVILPTGNQMVGTLAHKIIERLVREYAVQGALPEESGAIAGALFDEMVPAMAAELLQPGRSLARRRYRETVIAAVTELREVIGKLNLSIRDVERYLSAPWDLPLGPEGAMVRVDFRGPADMELADEEGAPFVLDLKYSYAESYYTDLVARGAALQLASYAWLIERNSGVRAVGSGYYLLPKQRLITDSSRAGDAALESERSLAEIWRRGEHSVVEMVGRLYAEGIVEVTGLQESELRETDGDDAVEIRRESVEESGGLYVEPPCAFCNYQIICGLGRGRI